MAGAIFFTLNKLLEKIPLAVKPFLPQLQRTFARGLADPSSETLRNRAAKGLGILITLTSRVDPLIAELITGSKTTDIGVKNAMMKALQEVVGKAGANMSEASRMAILALIDDDASDQNGEFISNLYSIRLPNPPLIDAVAITNARLLGVLVKVLPSATAVPLIRYVVLLVNDHSRWISTDLPEQEPHTQWTPFARFGPWPECPLGRASRRPNGTFRC